MPMHVARTLAFFSLTGIGLAAPGNPPAESCLVIEVLDGDTIDCRQDSRTLRIRLIGIDAPERHHPQQPHEFLADEASELLASLVSGRRVTLERAPGDREDRFGRELAYLTLNGQDIAEPLLSQGLARLFRRFDHPRRDRYSALERDAKSAQRGVWSGGGLDELKWARQQALEKIEVIPTGGAQFAVAIESWAKPGLTSSQLADAIWTARRAMRLLQTDRPTAEAQLRREGFVQLSAARRESPRSSPKGPVDRPKDSRPNSAGLTDSD